MTGGAYLVSKSKLALFQKSMLMTQDIAQSKGVNTKEYETLPGLQVVFGNNLKCLCSYCVLLGSICDFGQTLMHAVRSALPIIKFEPKIRTFSDPIH